MDRLLSPTQASELIPGMTTAKLAQLRFAGDGPPFMKPTPRTVVYRESEVMEWLESTKRARTNKPIEAARA